MKAFVVKAVFVSVFLSVCVVFNAHAQVAVVTAPILEGIAEATHLDQVMHAIQSIQQQIESATNTYNQFQNLLRQEELALKNLMGAGEIGSWDDLKEWYNRQLYLEKQAEDKFTELGVKIGGKNYKIADIEKIPGALAAEADALFANDFSEAQRKEMWLTLGITPANYVYIQTWKAREEELLKNTFTKREVVNEENMSAIERNNEILEMLKEDKRLPAESRMGEKALAELMVELTVDTNLAIRQMAYDQAEANELRAVLEQKKQALPSPPMLSESWDYDPFGSLSE
jgi:hypothetical protein